MRSRVGASWCSGSSCRSRSPVKAWTLGHHDHNHDGWLTLYEANEAVDEFKTIADSDRDGRVTPREYDGGIDYLKARYRPLPD